MYSVETFQLGSKERTELEPDTLRRLHDRIDSLGREVHTLQLTTVKREGPLVAELQAYHRKVDRLGDSVLTRDEFRKGMDEFREDMEDDSYRTFNKRDRYWAGALGLVTLGLQVTSVVYLIAASGH